jgi:hypothetical protein
MNEEEQGRRMEFFEWFLHMCDERESFPDLIVYSDEATFKFNCTASRHNCVYWATENPRVTEERAISPPGTLVWRREVCGMVFQTTDKAIFLKQQSQVLPTYQCCRTTLYLPPTTCFWTKSVTFNRIVLHHIAQRREKFFKCSFSW